MRSRSHRFEWIPAFLIGASAAIAAEVAIGILLYSGPGIMRSLTTVLAVEGGAFAIGLWSAPGPRPDLIERLRRRWLLCLFAFLVAALFGTSWALVDGVGRGALSQGLGLALLAGLPLYASGSVLGIMSTAAASERGGPAPGPGAPAAMGAAVGFVLTGLLLPRAPMPSSLLVACLVMLSFGGMVYGIVLGARLQVHVRARRPSGTGDVRVEDHSHSREDLADRVLFEGEHERSRLPVGDNGSVPWDVAAARAASVAEDVSWSVLVVGGGASSAPRTVLREHPLVRVEVLERSSAVVELAREHLQTDLTVGVGERSSVQVGNLEDLLAGIAGPYDLVIVDTRAFDAVGGLSGLSRRARSRLTELAGERGVVVWGPNEPEHRQGGVANDDTRRVLRRSVGGNDEVLVVTSAREPLPWSAGFEGFVPDGTEAAIK